ncbi:MAG: MlaD family protein [Methyloprofundus sp.]|nr:MlaD family protein [Methyloprofundus sp.]
MSKQANPTVIGVFVLGAVFIALVGLTVFTSGKWLTEKSQFVIYFNESVNGLNVGALVKMQGVPIGKVTDIQVQLHPQTKQILTPVFIEIDHAKCQQLLPFKESANKKMLLEQLVKNGLRMQLQYTSLVTGQLYVQSLLRADTPEILTGLNENYTELPAIASNSAEVQNSIADVMQDIRAIPFKELFAELLMAVKNIKQITGSEETKQVMTDLATSMAQLQDILKSVKPHAKAIALNAEQTLQRSNQLMYKLEGAVDPLVLEVRQALANTNQTLLSMQKSANSADDLLHEEGHLQKNLNRTLDEIQRSAKSLRLLTDYLEQHPEALLHGKKD